MNGRLAGRWAVRAKASDYLAVSAEVIVGFLDKLRNKAQMGRGHAKQEVGRATGDRSMEAEGQADRIGGSAKQVGEQVKDSAKNVKDAFGR